MIHTHTSKSGNDRSVHRHGALPVYLTVPAGCGLVFAPDDMHAPYLRCGQAAVVDPRDRRVRFGRLYLLRHDCHARIWLVAEAPSAGAQAGASRGTGARRFAMLHPLNRCADPSEAEWRLRNGVPLFFSDGPISLGDLAALVVARVIGVYVCAGQTCPEKAAGIGAGVQ